MASPCGCQDDALMAINVFFFIAPTLTHPTQGGGGYQLFGGYWTDGRDIFYASNRILTI
jgi:hypothetical protein